MTQSFDNYRVTCRVRDDQAARTISKDQFDQLKNRLAELEEKRRELFAETSCRSPRRKRVRPVPAAVAIQTQYAQVQTALQNYDANGEPKALAMGVTDKPSANSVPRPQQRLVRAMQPGRNAPELQTILDSLS